ncbi:unnamed protein product, partial [Rotaria magnacalcarata]
QTSQIDEHNDACLTQYAERQLDQNTNGPSDIQQQIDRLQSIVLRLASNIDTINQQSDTTHSPIVYAESNIKHEQMEDNEPSELEIEEDHDDETSDHNHFFNFPASTSTNVSFPPNPMSTKTIMYNGRNMMKHLRPRTTLTSFARHIASDLFSREEIMAKLHVDHNNERDIFLRHCICTAWNLTEQELYSVWPKIRNALLQLRRDAIAGKCIRMNKKMKQQEQDSNLHHFLFKKKQEIENLPYIIKILSKSGRQLLVNCESQATGHRVMRIRDRTQEKLEFLHMDPWLDQEVLYKETRKIKTLEKRNIREIHLSRLT